MNDRRIISVPDLGDFHDVEVIEVLVAPGDSIEIETPLITLETDKATMDVPATAAGRIGEVLVTKGSRVSQGDPIVALEGIPAGEAEQDSGGRAPTEAAVPSRDDTEPAAARQEQEQRSAPTTSGAVPAAEPLSPKIHAGPAVRRLARELGVDLGRVTGSARRGRITQQDVKEFVRGALSTGPAGEAGGRLPEVPAVDFAAYGPVDIRPLTRIQRIGGSRLQASWLNVPHVTQHDEADITELEASRLSLKEKATAAGVKLTMLAFVIHACARVLGRFPQFNSSLDPDGRHLVLKKYLHIGFAADTAAGLMVPVIHDVDRKDVYEIARDVSMLSEEAREGRLAAGNMRGGCFTISSLGGIGGTAFTPIINAPEVAILGVSRSRLQPVWRDGEFIPRLMLPLSLSYDHRVIDGADAVRFTVALADTLANPQLLLEAVP